MLVISGLTPDLARALDQMIDGKPDALEGMFRQERIQDVNNPGGPGSVWSGDNTYTYNDSNQGGPGGPAGGGTNFDEDQILTVVANYKMNQ
jgi:hypothetical protein